MFHIKLCGCQQLCQQPLQALITHSPTQMESNSHPVFITTGDYSISQLATAAPDTKTRFLTSRLKQQHHQDLVP